MTGCDVDAGALREIVHPAVRKVHANALVHDWGDERFDVVVGNPPFLSQLAADTTRGGSSPLGGGPYADSAAEFLALAVELASPDGGRVGMVLPQSVLGSRDAGPIRRRIDELAEHTWSWWEPEQRLFDASINVCALGLRRPARGGTPSLAWTRVVTDRLGIPIVDLDALSTDGTIGDRAELNANFRDEYYALVPAVSDDADGPPLVTSGLIDPGVCHWGARTVRFAKRDFSRPRVDLSKLEGRFTEWAERKLVPKVLVANQTHMVEAVADTTGAWLPGVPVTTVTPHGPDAVHEVARIEAVLTSPIASAMCWHVGGGTGLSTTAVRVGPRTIGDLPWPGGPLDDAVGAMRRGDVVGCGELVLDAYGARGPDRDRLVSWWRAGLPDPT